MSDIFLEYGDKFGESFPTYELGRDEELAMECIKKGKTAGELRHIDYGDNGEDIDY